MKKRVLALVLTAPLLFAITTVLAVGENLIFNIEGFQKYAVENSKQVTLDDLEIKTKESALLDAKEDAEFLYPASTKSERYNNDIKKDVTPLEAEANLEYAKRAKQKNIDNLKLDVYKAALNRLLIEKELDMQKAKLDILNEKYSMAEVRYREGKITENDLNDIKYSLDTKKIDVQKVEKSLKTAEMELKRLLSLELDDKDLKIDEKLTLAKWKSIKLEKVINDAIEKNIDIYKKSENLKVKEKIMEITEKYYTDSNSIYNENKTNLELARIELEDAKINLEVEIRNKYNNLLSAKDNVELASKWEDIQKKKLQNLELKLENGLVSRQELLSQQEKYLDAQYQTFAAIYDFNVLMAEFEALCN
ncbi:MAG TPA: TolC family protein [Acetivibrio sp.]|uniref:TolC family protein n=1 Tax=Acetivibrio sp. TaxID=1872092 RepID=UPI002C730490|nr:TolC family protein [Acetivibrio sp.]HOM01480.1 TolC family protein [Acetivibrio sp.]